MFAPRYFVALVATLLWLSRIIWPDIKFDSTSLYLFLFAAVVILIPDIGDLISRIKKIKKGDLEIELESKINALADQTERTEEAIERSEEGEFEIEFIPDEHYGRILEYTKDPRGGLVAIAVEIESTINRIARDYNISPKSRYLSPIKAVDQLDRKGILPSELPSLVRDFWTLRNRAFHSANFSLTDEQLYRLLDLGVRILDLLSVRKKDFPATNWLSGEDVMRKYDLSGNELLQHIENGLIAYPKNTDIAFKESQPLKMEEVWFESDYNDNSFLKEELPKWWFKRTDIEQYIHGHGDAL